MSAINRELDEVALRADARQGERVIGKVYDFLGRFVVFPSEHAQVATALWTIHTHLMDRWDSTPRLAFLSAEPESGKSRALEILELLVPRPVLAVNVTPAYLFRRVASKDGLPTILFDEIDTVFGPKAKENEELRAFLNAGHRRGNITGRCVTVGKTITLENMESYCAVAVAGLGWLPETILGRSVIIRMRRRREGEHVQPYRRREHVPDGERIYRLIETWARTQPTEIIDWPQMPPEIQDRDADVWEALVAIADAIGGTWPKRAREAAVALVTASREREPSLGIRLLADVRDVFGDAHEMPTENILRKLHNLKESPWSDLKGKPLNDRGLAQRLRQYEVKPVVLAGGAQRGYRREDLHDAWERYLTPLSPAARGVTSVTSVTGGSDVTDVTDVTDAQGKGRGYRCAQCSQSGDIVQVYYGEAEPVWLHRVCEGDWIAADIPPILDRRLTRRDCQTRPLMRQKQRR